MRTPSLLGLAILFAAAASAQQAPQLKARELFYTPIPEPDKSAPKPTTKSAAAKPSKPKQTSPAPSDVEATPQTAKKADPPNSPDGSPIENAAQVIVPPLALKYRLLKRSSEGRFDEVDTDTVFRSGDSIRVSVEANDGAYLYIVQQGSSQKWEVLFPNNETGHGSNHVDRNREYEIPGKRSWLFDERPGAEKLFIVLARKPEADLEKLIYSLSQSGDSVKPAASDSPEQQKQMVVAQNKIDASVIDRIRGKVLARDLVFERVDENTPASPSVGKRKEKAAYVASLDRSANARLVVDLTLNHQ